MWNGDDMSGQSLVRGSDTREKRKKKKILLQITVVNGYTTFIKFSRLDVYGKRVSLLTDLTYIYFPYIIALDS